MPSFRFQGFPETSAVALTVSQGGVSDSATVASWGVPTGGGGPASLSIDAVFDATSLVAPIGIWFEARPSGLGVEEVTLPPSDLASTPAESTVQVYDPAFHEIEYFWTITRPGGAVSEFQTTDLNLPQAWRNRNVEYGKKIAVCFDEPGAYTVECFAVGPTGTTATATYRFAAGGDAPEIEDPDLHYGQAFTIAVNPVGDTDFTGSGAAPSNCFSFDQWNVAHGRYWADWQNNRARIVFKRGGTYDFSGEPFWFFDRRSQGIDVGAYGAGPKPVLNVPNSRVINISRDWAFTSARFHGLSLVGAFDSTTQTGHRRSAISILQAPAHYTFHQLDFSGFMVTLGMYSQLFWADGEVASRGVVAPVIYSECGVTNWARYGLFANHVTGSREAQAKAKLALIGCSLAQDVNTLMGKLNDKTYISAHGPLRIQYIQETILSACDFFTRGGWAGYQCQPCLRLNQGPFEELGGGTQGDRGGFPYLSLSRIACESGGAIAGISDNGAGYDRPDVHPENPTNTVIDRAIFLGSSRTGSPLEVTGGCTLRNSTIILPRTEPGFAQGSTTSAILVGTRTDPITALNRAQPVRIYNNTIVSLRTAAQAGHNEWSSYNISAAQRYDTFIDENNVVQAPNYATPINPDDPFLRSTVAGYTPRFNGERFNFEDIEISVASMLPGDTFEILYSAIPMTTPDGRTAIYGSGTLDQAYWLSANPDDQDHILIDTGSGVFWFAQTDFQASYEADRITFTVSSFVTSNGDDARHFASGDVIASSSGGTATVEGWRQGQGFGLVYLSNVSGSFNPGDTVTGGSRDGGQAEITTVPINGTMRLHVDRSSILPATNTALATPADTTLFWDPDTGSAAYKSVTTGLATTRDIFGRARTSPSSRGAYEPTT